jgi:glycosyltransferase involved in cell wall biosynthesis
MMPRLSVCIPVYNGARYLNECLRSVLAQSFRDFELVVVDDASTDATREIVARVAAHEPRLRLVRNERNLGLVANWNRCVRLARAPWIKFVFQDDLLAPSCLEELYAARDGRSPLVVCRRSYLFEPGVSAGIREMYRDHLKEHTLESRFPGRAFIPPEDFSRAMLAKPGINCIGEPTSTLIHRGAFRRYGLFKSDLVSLCDWEFFARVAVNAGLSRVPKVLTTFRVHSKAASAVNRRARAFQTDYIDELIIRHDLAFSRAYEALRREAQRRRPASDLLGSLARAAERCGALARRDSARRVVLNRTLSRYPRLISAASAADERLKVARGLWRAQRA